MKTQADGSENLDKTCPTGRCRRKRDGEGRSDANHTLAFYMGRLFTWEWEAKVNMGGIFTWEWEAKVCKLSCLRSSPFLNSHAYTWEEFSHGSGRQKNVNFLAFDSRFFSIYANIHGRTFHKGVGGKSM